MERELWGVLYREVRKVGRDFSQKYAQIQPWVLVACSLWAILHDRPASWACDERNWGTTTLRPWRLPSPSALSRRAYQVGVGLLWRALEQRLRDCQDPALVAFLDGKPLPVGGYSKDPDAGYGRGAGTMDKGYKLHTVWSNRATPEAWEVTSLKVGETTAAAELIGQLQFGGYLLGDSNYDSSPLFDRAAGSGYQLVVAIGHPNAGKGHHYQSPHRKRCIEMMRRDNGISDFGRVLYRMRPAIERSYGNATSFAGGLAPLPSWTRRLKRVRFWVWGKLLINAVRILRNKGLTSSLQ
jgi:Transposase DDE domain